MKTALNILDPFIKRYTDPKKAYSSVVLLVRVLSYSFSYPFLLASLYLATFASAILETYNPPLGEQLMHILTSGDVKVSLNRALIIRFTIDISTTVIDAAYYVIKSHVGMKVDRKMQEDFYRSLLSKDTEFYDGKKIGDLTSKLDRDLGSLKQMAIGDIVNIAHKLFSITGSIVFMFNISPSLLVLFLVLLCPRAGIMWKSRDFFREGNKKIMGLRGDANAVATEAFFNIKIIKCFSSEDKEFKKYHKRLDELYDQQAKIASKNFMESILKNLLRIVLFGALAFQGGHMVLNSNITAFELTRFISYARQLSMSVLWLEGDIKKISVSLTNAERIFKELDEKPKVDATTGALRLVSGLKADIILKDVSFSYPHKKQVNVLKNVNLEIKKGQHLAIVGESGGGKSTIVNLLQRLYDPTKGQVLIGGHDLKEFDLKWVHSRMGVISQDPGLFSGTFEDNVTYGVEMYGDEDVDNAMTSAHMKRFVNDKEQFPDGLQTNVGERGNKLSGGQKQRVAIARALIKKPDVLILDEATSALDSESEHQIMKGMEQLLRDKSKTVIIIAHRLSTIKHCDKIVVCEGGEIVEEGDHESLMRKEDGVYRNLVDKQHFSVKQKTP